MVALEGGGPAFAPQQRTAVLAPAGHAATLDCRVLRLRDKSVSASRPSLPLHIHEIRLQINLLVLIVVLTSSSTFAFPMTNKKKRANLSTVCIEEQHNKINYRQDIIIMHMSVISMLCLHLIE